MQYVTTAAFLLTVGHDYYSSSGQQLSHCSSPVDNAELLAAGNAQVGGTCWMKHMLLYLLLESPKFSFHSNLFEKSVPHVLMANVFDSASLLV